MAVWLEEQGFPARVMNASTLAGLPSLYSPVETDAGGVEVWVLDEAKARRRSNCWKSIPERWQSKQPRPHNTSPIEVVVNNAAERPNFPKEYGSVQECPHCGEYLDVGESGDDETPDAISGDTDEDDAE